MQQNISFGQADDEIQTLARAPRDESYARAHPLPHEPTDSSAGRYWGLFHQRTVCSLGAGVLAEVWRAVCR
jgi:hypothetical protein